MTTRQLLIRTACCLTCALAWTLPTLSADTQQNKKSAQGQTESAKQAARIKLNQQQATDGKQDNQPPQISRKRKKQLMQFVQQNHPQLESLLGILEKKRADKFKQALQGLNRDFSRLEQVAGNEERYKDYLARWKLKSRIDLMAARTVLSATPENRKKLKGLLKQEFTARATQLKEEREKLQQRLTRINQALSKLEKNPAAEIDKRMELVLKKSRNALGVNQKKQPKSNKEN